jgi:hypothetical protein
MTTAEWKAKKRAEGLCHECFRQKPIAGIVRCQECREKHNTREINRARAVGTMPICEVTSQMRSEITRRGWVTRRKRKPPQSVPLSPGVLPITRMMTLAAVARVKPTITWVEISAGRSNS